MARIETWFDQDLKKAVKVHYLDGNVFSRDNNGNVIGVRVYSGSQTASLSGTVSASIVRADGATIVVAGTLADNMASVVLPQAAYAVPGVLSIVIKLTNGADITALCAVVANVYMSSTDSVVDPGTIIPSIDALIAEIDAAVASIPADYSALWASLAPVFSNATAYRAGQFVTYDGGLYEFIADHPAGTWDGGHVSQVNVGSALFSLGCAAKYTEKIANPIYGNKTTEQITATRYAYNNIPYAFKKGVLYKVSIVRSVNAPSDIDFALANGWTYVDRYVGVMPTATHEITFAVIPSADASDLRIAYAETTAGVTYRMTVETSIVAQSFENASGNLYEITDPLYGRKTTTNATSVAYKYTNIPCDFKRGNIYKIRLRINTPAPVDFNISTSNGDIYVDQNVGAMKEGMTESVFVVTPTADATHLRVMYAGSTILNYKLEAECDPYTFPVKLLGNFADYWYQYANKITDDPGYRSILYDVSGYKKVRLVTYYDSYVNYATFLDANNNVLQFSYKNTIVDEFVVFDFVVPDGAITLVSSGVPWKTGNNACYGLASSAKEPLPLNKKKINWYGTSIPAGGYFGTTNPNGYPYQVAQKLGATCNNLAIGSSCVHYRFTDRVSANNPYGFGDNFEAASRCLTNSVEMMNWIIENYNSGVFTRNVPSTMDDLLKWRIRQGSYENRISYYLADPSRLPDIWVFDHGHNDYMGAESLYSEADPFNTFTFHGGMNFLFNLILSAYPHQKIVMIGEYENQHSPLIAQNQEIVANDWSVPLMPLWEYLGWSQKVVNTKGGWVDGYWQDNAYPNGHNITLLDAALCDGIHPHSDLSGKALNYVAYHVAGWLKNYTDWG